VIKPFTSGEGEWEETRGLHVQIIRKEKREECFEVF
jgi:hypothetical protein